MQIKHMLILPYMPTFPIYAGFSRFEAVEKLNPDIPIGIAKLLRNPDFRKTYPLSRRKAPNSKIPRHFVHASQSEIGTSCPPLLVYMFRVLWTGVIIPSYETFVTVFIKEDFN